MLIQKSFSTSKIEMWRLHSASISLLDYEFTIKLVMVFTFHLVPPQKNPPYFYNYTHSQGASRIPHLICWAFLSNHGCTSGQIIIESLKHWIGTSRNGNSTTSLGSLFSGSCNSQPVSALPEDLPVQETSPWARDAPLSCRTSWHWSSSTG